MGTIMLERSRMVKLYPYPLKHRVYLPKWQNQQPFRQARHMTLIGAHRCSDGLVIASDTAVELGDAVYQAHKIAHYRDENGRYEAFVACCGVMPFAESCSQKIRDELADAKSACSLAEIREVIELTLKRFYDDHIWPASHAGVDTRMSLVMAVRNVSGQVGVFKTHLSTLHDSAVPVFDGSGEPVARFLSERMLVNPHAISTATAVHLFGEIFRAAKKSSAGVGGDTEIYAVRVAEDAERFFEIRTGKPLFLWALDANLHTAIRAALEPTSQILESRIEQIGVLLRAMRKEAEADRQPQPGKMAHWTEREDGNYRIQYY